MNLPDYFEPVDFETYKPSFNSLGKYALGPAIEKATANLFETSGKKPDVLIIGVPFENGKIQKKEVSVPDNIRRALYGLAVINSNIRIADAGNLKSTSSLKGIFLAIRDITEYLKEMGVVPVFLGGSQELTSGICEAFKNERFFWLSLIDAVCDVKKSVEKFDSTNYLSRIFKNLPNIFQFSLIGYQNHLVGDQLIKKTPGTGEHLRLGELRNNIMQAEQLLRNSNVLSFDMGSVKYTEAPATTQKNPNGLRGEEACQLARFAGLSPNIKAFGLFETTAQKNDNTTAKLAAEIVWYFLEALAQRKPARETTVFKVEIDGLDNPLVFKHEEESNRWWFEARSISGDSLEVACSEDDYRQAAENEIPERWLRIVQKMDGISK